MKPSLAQNVHTLTFKMGECETGHCQTRCVSKKLIPEPGDGKLIPRINHFKSCVPATSRYRKVQNLLRQKIAQDHSIQMYWSA